MDEPLASLDAQRKDEVLSYIARLRDEFDVPILYVSHHSKKFCVWRLRSCCSIAGASSRPARWRRC